MKLPKQLCSDALSYQKCHLCPHQCLVDRRQTLGVCGISTRPSIYQNFIHLGEEHMLTPALVINMCGCNLACPTCPERHRWHNALPIKDAPSYAQLLAQYMAKKMPKSLEWVGGEPTIQLPFLLETTYELRHLLESPPTIYCNSNMYFAPEILPFFYLKEERRQNPLIDAFVFDLKAMPCCCASLTGASDYFDIVTQNIAQIVQIAPNAPHIMRHLVMPGHEECCTRPILLWCEKNIPRVTFNLMTTFHDFRPNANSNLFLAEEEKRKAIDALLKSELPNILVDGQPLNGER